MELEYKYDCIKLTIKIYHCIEKLGVAQNNTLLCRSLDLNEKSSSNFHLAGDVCQMMNIGY